MDLFDQSDFTIKNLLPRDGVVNYFGSVFKRGEADHFLNALLSEIEWKNDETIMFGKTIITKRKVAWYGDKPFKYTYSKSSKVALPWTKDLLVLKEKVQELSNEEYNSCLLNLYHSGEEGMSWHSDAEPELKEDGAIASLSFGAERKFSFKHKISAEKIQLVLEHGSLLIMKGTTQKHWLHRLPSTKIISNARVNLTFRSIQG